jgi:hypothetical protein
MVIVIVRLPEEKSLPAADVLIQPHRQRQLNVAVAAFVAVDKILQEKRNVALLQVAAAPQLVGDLDGNIAAPACVDIENDNPDRTGILAGEQIHDDGLEAGCLGVHFCPDPSVFEGMMLDDMDIVLVTVGHD